MRRSVLWSFVFSAFLGSAAGTAHAEDFANRFDGFVYVLGAVNDGDGPAVVEAFGRERIGGKLDYIGRTLTGGNNSSDLAGLQQDALVSDGRHVYAVNTGSNTVSAMTIGRHGQLSLIQQLSSGGLRPVSIAIHGNHLYVANAGQTPEEEPKPSSVVGFNIRLDGSLAPLPCEAAAPTPGEIFNVLGDLTINASGTTLVVAGLGSNNIDSFNIDARGCLTKRTNLPGGGGAFSVNFRPGTNDAVISRALPELWSDQKAPGVGSFKVGHDSSIVEVDAYIDADQSDTGLRDPCWMVFARDNVHFWTSSFIPRSLNAFSLDWHGKLRRLSERQPNDTVPDPTNPGGTLTVGAFDIAMDGTKEHLYQLREFQVPDGSPVVPGSIRTFELTGDYSKDAGLREVQVTPLPDELGGASVVGLVFVDRNR